MTLNPPSAPKPQSPFEWRDTPRQTDIGAKKPGNRGAPRKKAERERDRVMANRWGSPYLKPKGGGI